MVRDHLLRTIAFALAVVTAGLLATCGRQSAPPKEDVTPPSVISEYPDNLTVDVDVNTAIIVTFSEPVDASSVSRAAFKVRDGGNVVVDGDIAVGSGGTVKFTPGRPLAYSTTYIVTIEAGVQDLAGNAMTSSHSFVFTTGVMNDTTPPRIASANPTGSSGVGINEIISVSFNERMDEDTVTPASFAVSDGVSGVAGTISSFEGKTFVFTSGTGTLRYSTTYSVTIDGAVTDLAGNRLADAEGNPLASFTWSFRTQDPAPDVPAPIVLSTIPAGGALNVSRAITTIVASFSEMMLASSITGTTFVVGKQQGGAAVPGVVQASGATAVFTPASPLEYLTSYVVTLVTGSRGVRDLAGNPVVSNSPGGYLWSFETEALPTYVLTVTRTGSGSGTVTASPGPLVWSGNVGTASYDYNALVTLTAGASVGSTFSGWSGEGCSGTGACTVTMSSARSVSAQFASVLFTVSASAGAGGTISPASRLVSYGSTTTFTITPDPEFSIDAAGGTCGGSLAGNIYTTRAITADCTVTASFRHPPVNGACGAADGQTFTTMPTADLCSAGDATEVSGTGPWTWECTGLYGGKTAACNAKIQTYTVSSAAGPGGKIEPATRTVNHGLTTTFTVTPSAGYLIGEVTGCGGTLAGDVYTTGPITAACTVSAAFVNAPVNGACGSANGGTFTAAPATNLCSEGNATAVAGGGPWTWDCTGLYGGTTASCSANIRTFTVSTSAGTGGSIAPASVTVNYGSTTTLTVSALSGFSVASVSGCDGASYTNSDPAVTAYSYTTGAVTGNCTVTCTFTAI